MLWPHTDNRWGATIYRSSGAQYAELGVIGSSAATSDRVIDYLAKRCGSAPIAFVRVASADLAPSVLREVLGTAQSVSARLQPGSA